jgi:hypothetical protein
VGGTLFDHFNLASVLYSLAAALLAATLAAAPVFGAIVGLAQWLVLKRYAPITPQWIGAAAIGLPPIVWFITVTLGELGVRLEPVLESVRAARDDALALAFGALQGALVGAGIAVTQTLAVGLPRPEAARWAAANALAGAAAVVIATLAISYLVVDPFSVEVIGRSGDDPASTSVRVGLSLAVFPVIGLGAALYGCITGVFVLSLLAKMPLDQPQAVVSSSL